MNILAVQQLSEKQQKQVQALQEQCCREDGLKNRAFLSNDINFDKELPGFYLGMEGDTLVAFLSVFMPSCHEGEIVAFTHPQWRRQGRFTALLDSAAKALSPKVSQALFVIEPQSINGTAVCKTFSQAKWQRSEYTLFHDGREEPPCCPQLKIRPAMMEDAALCVAINDRIFTDYTGENEGFILNALTAADRKLYLAFFEEEAVGCFNLHFTNGQTFLYGVGILPEHRGKGYGRQLLGEALREGLPHGKVVLDVDSGNRAAYALYTHHGFRPDFQADYYVCPWPGIQRTEQRAGH